MKIGEVYNAVRSRYSIPFEIVDVNRTAYVQYSCKEYEANLCMSIKMENCILVNYMNKKKLSGYGRPCDNMEEVYEALDKVLPLKNYEQATLF